MKDSMIFLSTVYPKFCASCGASLTKDGTVPSYVKYDFEQDVVFTCVCGAEYAYLSPESIDTLLESELIYLE